MSASPSDYLLAGPTDPVARRHVLLGELFDPWSMAVLKTVGIAQGWACWEVSAGGGGLISRLLEAVGPTGRVLATDLDLRSLPASSGALEVRRHDVAADAAPVEAFDLIHARLLLVHLPQRDAVVRSLVERLRPSGWLVLEDADPGLQPLACIDPSTLPEHRANEIRSGFRSLLAARGADLAFGRSLPRRLRAVGLSDVRSEAHFPMVHPACAALELATLDLIGDQLLDAGKVDPTDLDAHRAAVRAGEIDLVQPPMISAWGQRPLDG